MSKNINAEIIKEIVMKLVGDIHPAGATHLDNERLENLEIYIDLVSGLTEELYWVADNRNDYRASVKHMGYKAFKYLKNEYELLPEYFEELEEEE